MRTPFIWRGCLALAVAIAVWVAVTKWFWVGYAGTDDLYYSRYAFLFHRAPINWWEGRLPAILAIRAAFLWLGPTEFAAALPTLICALAGTAAIAWYVKWPRELNWRTNATILLAATLPLDVTMRTVPGAIYAAAGLLIVGSVCVLKGSRFAGVAGCICFALAMLTHELSLFYTGIFLGTAVLFDRKRFQRYIVMSGVFALIAFGTQAAYYGARFGDPLLRLHLAASESKVSGLIDPDNGIQGVAFLLWPLKTMIFSKVFACDLLLVFALGAACWKKLLTDQRIILISGFATWFYLGYGSKVPWSYRPLARMYHFYGPLVLCVSVLLPVCIKHWPSKDPLPRRYAVAAVTAIVALHLVCLAGGGKWGQDVRVSKSLMEYAARRPSSLYLTDVSTMNKMYVQNGFRMPLNIVCVNGPDAERNLLINKEPPNPATPHGVTFPDVPVDGVLLNLDGDLTNDPDFRAYLAGHPGEHERIAPVRVKPLFAMAPAFLRLKEFAIASEGAELVRRR